MGRDGSGPAGALEALRTLIPAPRGAYRVWRRSATIFRKRWLTILIPNFVEPLLYLAALGLGLGAFIREGGIGGQSYPQYIAPGLLAANAMFAASFESTFNTFVKLKVDRVYEAIVSTPVNVEDAIAGEYLWAGTRAVMQGTVFLTVLTLLGLISSPWAILIPLVLLVVGMMFSVMGTLFTSLIPTIDLYGYYFTLVITPLFLFSGIFFPIDGFPAPIPQIAWFTPLYHAVNACRELATGPSAAIFVDLGWMMLFTATLSLIPIYFMRRRLIN